MHLLGTFLMVLDILGVRFRVVYKAMRDMGRCDTEHARITIRSTLAPDVKVSTLWHELIHAIEQQLDLDLTEKQVDGLASGLSSIPQLNIGPDRE